MCPGRQTLGYWHGTLCQRLLTRTMLIIIYRPMSLKHAAKRRRVKVQRAAKPKVEQTDQPQAETVIDLDVITGDVATETKTEMATEQAAVARYVMSM